MPGGSVQQEKQVDTQKESSEDAVVPPAPPAVNQKEEDLACQAMSVQTTQVPCLWEVIFFM